jgi:two-component system sensor histidine kinase KdpD
MVFAIVVFYRRIVGVNPTTVALTFLLAVLVVSASWGLRYAVFLALAATLAFNYYFLPPTGKFVIADPQNWVAMFAFLVTAVVAGELSERARREALGATRRRREVERLYTFSQRLLVAENVVELLNAIPRHIVEVFGVTEAALFLQKTGEIYRSSGRADLLSLDELKATTARGESSLDNTRDVFVVPVRLGVRPVGAFGIVGSLSRETLEAIGSLIAIAVERARAVESLGRNEAAREGEKLRTALLDSVTHEFRTPLTSIKASVTSLLSGVGLSEPDRHELLTVIDEECDRLNRLVGEAAEMARLESHEAKLDLQPRDVRGAIDAALEHCASVLGEHPLEVQIPADLPRANIDVDRIKEVMIHLLENAARYSPPDSPIRITAEAADGGVAVSVSDQGAGIDDFEQALIFDKFYRGQNRRYSVQGTGMGLAIVKAIVEAHGGVVSVVSQLGKGSVFRFTVPRG